jgi:hypothetical protein
MLRREKTTPSLGSYLTDGTRLLQRVPIPSELGRRVALEDCASLAVEYYSWAHFKQLKLKPVSIPTSDG